MAPFVKSLSSKLSSCFCFGKPSSAKHPHPANQPNLTANQATTSPVPAKPSASAVDNPPSRLPAQPDSQHIHPRPVHAQPASQQTSPPSAQLLTESRDSARAEPQARDEALKTAENVSRGDVIVQHPNSSDGAKAETRSETAPTPGSEGVAVREAGAMLEAPVVSSTVPVEAKPTVVEAEQRLATPAISAPPVEDELVTSTVDDQTGVKDAYEAETRSGTAPTPDSEGGTVREADAKLEAPVVSPTVPVEAKPTVVEAEQQLATPAISAPPVEDELVTSTVDDQTGVKDAYEAETRSETAPTPGSEGGAVREAGAKLEAPVISPTVPVEAEQGLPTPAISAPPVQSEPVISNVDDQTGSKDAYEAETRSETAPTLDSEGGTVREAGAKLEAPVVLPTVPAEAKPTVVEAEQRLATPATSAPPAQDELVTSTVDDQTGSKDAYEAETHTVPAEAKPTVVEAEQRLATPAISAPPVQDELVTSTVDDQTGVKDAYEAKTRSEAAPTPDSEGGTVREAGAKLEAPVVSSTVPAEAKPTVVEAEQRLATPAISAPPVQDELVTSTVDDQTGVKDAYEAETRSETAPTPDSEGGTVREAGAKIEAPIVSPTVPAEAKPTVVEAEKGLPTPAISAPPVEDETDFSNFDDQTGSKDAYEAERRSETAPTPDSEGGAIREADAKLEAPVVLRTVPAGTEQGIVEAEKGLPTLATSAPSVEDEPVISTVDDQTESATGKQGHQLQTAPAPPSQQVEPMPDIRKTEQRLPTLAPLAQSVQPEAEISAIDDQTESKSVYMTERSDIAPTPVPNNSERDGALETGPRLKTAPVLPPQPVQPKPEIRKTEQQPPTLTSSAHRTEPEPDICNVDDQIDSKDIYNAGPQTETTPTPDNSEGSRALDASPKLETAPGLPSPPAELKPDTRKTEPRLTPATPPPLVQPKPENSKDDDQTGPEVGDQGHQPSLPVDSKPVIRRPEQRLPTPATSAPQVQPGSEISKFDDQTKSAATERGLEPQTAPVPAPPQVGPKPDVRKTEQRLPIPATSSAPPVHPASGLPKVDGQTESEARKQSHQLQTATVPLLPSTGIQPDIQKTEQQLPTPATPAQSVHHEYEVCKVDDQTEAARVEPESSLNPTFRPSPIKPESQIQTRSPSSAAVPAFGSSNEELASQNQLAPVPVGQQKTLVAPSPSVQPKPKIYKPVHQPQTTPATAAPSVQPQPEACQAEDQTESGAGEQGNQLQTTFVPFAPFDQHKPVIKIAEDQTKPVAREQQSPLKPAFSFSPDKTDLQSEAPLKPAFRFSPSKTDTSNDTPSKPVFSFSPSKIDTPNNTPSKPVFGFSPSKIDTPIETPSKPVFGFSSNKTDAQRETPSKPAFSFSPNKTDAPSDAPLKPAFSFSPDKTDARSDAPVKPAFSFSPNKTDAQRETALKPAFSFSPNKTDAQSDAPLKPAFSFSPDKTDPQSDAPMKPAFSFSSNNTDTSNETPLKSAFSFSPSKPDTQGDAPLKPAFSFSPNKTDAQRETPLKPAFSFSPNKPETQSKALLKPAFSFSASKPDTQSDAPLKSAFSFGSSNTESQSMAPLNPGFSFSPSKTNPESDTNTTASAAIPTTGVAFGKTEPQLHPLSTPFGGPALKAPIFSSKEEEDPPLKSGFGFSPSKTEPQSETNTTASAATPMTDVVYSKTEPQLQPLSAPFGGPALNPPILDSKGLEPGSGFSPSKTEPRTKTCTASLAATPMTDVISGKIEPQPQSQPLSTPSAGPTLNPPMLGSKGEEEPPLKPGFGFSPSMTENSTTASESKPTLNLSPRKTEPELEPMTTPSARASHELSSGLGSNISRQHAESTNMSSESQLEPEIGQASAGLEHGNTQPKAEYEGEASITRKASPPIYEHRDVDACEMDPLNRAAIEHLQKQASSGLDVEDSHVSESDDEDSHVSEYESDESDDSAVHDEDHSHMNRQAYSLLDHDDFSSLNQLVVRRDTIRGVVALNEYVYAIVFEEIEESARYSIRAPHFDIYWIHENGRKERLGAAWDKTGRNCGRYFWIIFEVRGQKLKFNAFRRHESRGAVVHELVRVYA